MSLVVVEGSRGSHCVRKSGAKSIMVSHICGTWGHRVCCSTIQRPAASVESAGWGNK